MNEKNILKETVTPIKVESEKRPKKKYHKHKKLSDTVQSEINDIMAKNIHEVLNAEKPFISEGIKVKKSAGSYNVGKSFHIYFDKKPILIHRFFTKLLLGWKWRDQK